jgi:hypothetical protein
MRFSCADHRGCPAAKRWWRPTATPRSVTAAEGNDHVASHFHETRLVGFPGAGILAPVAAHADSTQQQANIKRFATRQLALTDAAIQQEALKVQQATGEQRDIETLKLKQLIDRRQQQVEVLKQISQQLSEGN